ncbi:MAG: hypothetical protein H2076_05170 [Planctomycetes bacterium]|nr:hypothetical protein [Planctomycetota bacterium]
MSYADQERLTLIEGSTWRQTALPAGRIAVARGGLIFFLLASFYWLLVPLGPETTPTAELIASYWTSHSSPSVAASIQSGLLSFLTLLFPVAFSAKFLEITEVCLAFAVLVCWMRQLDASRSTVIPTALIIGLSPGLCSLVIEGGELPLMFLSGAILLATTDQVRAEAGRGVFFVGLTIGTAVALGPAMLPVLIYSLATMLFDRGIRGVRSRGWIAILLGLMTGLFSSLLLGHALQGGDPPFSNTWTSFSEAWLVSLQQISTPSIEVLVQSTREWGLVATAFTLPGLIWALLRRPGDVALLLVIITSGAFIAPAVLPGVNTTDVADLDPFSLFSALPAAVFCSWTLTLAHRSLARFQPSKKLLVSLSSILISATIPFLVTPPLWKPSSELVRQWGISVLQTVPSESLVLTGGRDQGIALEAIQWLEKIRPDVTLLDPRGEILPVRLGLPADTKKEIVLKTLRELNTLQRPLVFLPQGLSHPLASRYQVQPQALWFEIRRDQQPIASDLPMWNQISLPHLPQSPEAAWRWLRGEGAEPPRRGRLAGKVAAESWLALARSQGELRFDGNWTAILALLEDLHHDPEEVQKWLQHQDAELPRVSPAGRTRD